MDKVLKLHKEDMDVVVQRQSAGDAQRAAGEGQPVLPTGSRAGSYDRRYGRDGLQRHQRVPVRHDEGVGTEPHGGAR